MEFVGFQAFYLSPFKFFVRVIDYLIASRVEVVSIVICHLIFESQPYVTLCEESNAVYKESFQLILIWVQFQGLVLALTLSSEIVFAAAYLFTHQFIWYTNKIQTMGACNHFDMNTYTHFKLSQIVCCQYTTYVYKQNIIKQI